MTCLELLWHSVGSFDRIDRTSFSEYAE